MLSLRGRNIAGPAWDCPLSVSKLSSEILVSTRQQNRQRRDAPLIPPLGNFAALLQFEQPERHSQQGPRAPELCSSSTLRLRSQTCTDPVDKHAHRCYACTGADIHRDSFVHLTIKKLYRFSKLGRAQETIRSLSNVRFQIEIANQILVFRVMSRKNWTASTVAILAAEIIKNQ
jgi:hypothetical protein